MAAPAGTAQRHMHLSTAKTLFDAQPILLFVLAVSFGLELHNKLSVFIDELLGAIVHWERVPVVILDLPAAVTAQMTPATEEVHRLLFVEVYDGDDVCLYQVPLASFLGVTEQELQGYLFEIEASMTDQTQETVEQAIANGRF